MSDPGPAPVPGTLYFFDNALPPLTAGRYRVSATTDVSFDSEGHALADTRHIEIAPPRFSLPSDEVVAVYPPANSEVDADEALPHVVLRRRTLPWARPLDASNLIGDPTRAPNDPPPAGPAPWMALLLLEEGEYEILPDVPLEQAVPPGVFARLGSPAGVRCQAVEVDRTLLASLLPSKEELALLAHVRRVSVEDRELGAGETDGWFATVLANRLPQAGSLCRACLVSLEERADLVQRNPPLVGTGPLVGPVHGFVAEKEVRAIRAGFRFDAAAAPFATEAVITADPTSARLVLLHSWRFTAAGAGSFRERMQALDVAMLGTVRGDEPRVADTGHLPLLMQDRAGYEDTVWYRGPAVPFPLTRDPLGPYHAADQALRVSPETGAQDISYAAAFEVGRLLAMSDPRLAQEALAWRRTAAERGARSDVDAALTTLAFVPDAIGGGHAGSSSWRATTGVLRELGSAPMPTADPTGLRATRTTLGLDPVELASAWALPSTDAARALVDPEAHVLGAPVNAAREIGDDR